MRLGRVEDLPVPRSVQRAVQAFLTALHKEGGARVEEVIVYGSAVRGEYGDDSDVDLLVHWGGEESDARDILANISTDILADHGVLINAFPLDHEHQERVAALDTRFHRNVQAEGVVVGA